MDLKNTDREKTIYRIVEELNDKLDSFHKRSDIFSEYRHDDVNKVIGLLKNNLNTLVEGKIPNEYPNMSDCFGTELCMFRDAFIKLQGFSLVSKNWIKELLPYLNGKKVLEVMAGYGTISYALQSEGINVIAIDDYSWKDDYRCFNKNLLWADVENLDVIKAINKYVPDVIIMSWPPYNEDVAYRTIMEMRKVNPNCEMIYIGEREGGCTADDDFFEVVEFIDNVFIDKANKFYTSWNFIHDKVMLVK